MSKNDEKKFSRSDSRAKQLERLKSEQYNDPDEDFDENEEPDDYDNSFHGESNPPPSAQYDHDAMHLEFLEKEKARQASTAYAAPSTQSENRRPNSIDILEESLLLAYTARKKSIEQRLRSTRNKAQRSNRYGAKSRTRSSTTPRRQYSDETVHDNDQDDDVPQLSVSPTTSRPPPALSSSSSVTQTNTHVSSSPKRHTQDKKSTTRPPLSTAFSTLEDQLHDKEAAEIFEAFKKDLSHWYKTNPLKRSDEEIRGDVADDLTERYLCQRLDPLPASRVVTNIRKVVSQIIEEFAATGVLPLEMSGEKKTGQDGPVTKYAQQKAVAEMEAQRAAAEAEAKRKATIEKNAADRAAAEKKRMKEQYEQYMALKRQSADTEDNKKANEIETHLDDIRSLISSIKGAGGDASSGG